MAITEAKLRANDKYRKKFEYLQARVTAEDKEIIVNHAESMGESINAFMCRAMAETMERDKEKTESKTE